MGRLFSANLALGLIFVTEMVVAAPQGSPQDYTLQTKYLCQAMGVVVHSKQKLISNGQGVGELQFVASAGQNQALTFGQDREYMIWPRVASGNFTKSLNVLSRDRSGVYKIMQEVDMGDALRTKTSISLSVPDARGETRPVSCRIEMTWLKR